MHIARGLIYLNWIERYLFAFCRSCTYAVAVSGAVFYCFVMLTRESRTSAAIVWVNDMALCNKGICEIFNGISFIRWSGKLYLTYLKHTVDIKLEFPHLVHGEQTLEIF